MNAAEVIAQVLYERLEWSGCNGSRWDLQPDQVARIHQAQVWLEALKAAGFVVIELPKPADVVDDGYRAHFFAPANGNSVRLRWSKDIVVDGNWYRPDEARDVAAALLAAADAAVDE